MASLKGFVEVSIFSNDGGVSLTPGVISFLETLRTRVAQWVVEYCFVLCPELVSRWVASTIIYTCAKPLDTLCLESITARHASHTIPTYTRPTSLPSLYSQNSQLSTKLYRTSTQASLNEHVKRRKKRAQRFRKSISCNFHHGMTYF